MTDNATVDFYNKYIERMRIKMNELMTSGLKLETQLWLLEEKVVTLTEENEKLEKKVKDLEKKVDGQKNG